MKPGRSTKLILFLLSLIMIANVHQTSAQKNIALSPVNLRCEYAVNPIGIDAANPRFSWIFEPTQRGQRQTAYQILVASTESNLKADRGDLWDSGKVASDESIHIAYAGKPLQSRQRAHWKVKVWDRDGRSSTSATAFFEIGLLAASDWKAKWITIQPASGPENDDDRSPLAKARWIYAPNQPPVEPGQKLQFWRLIAIPPGARVITADMHYAADFRERERGTNLFVNNALDPSLWRSARKLNSPSIFNLRYALKPGENTIAVEAAYGPNRGFIALIHIELDNGQEMDIPTDGQWKARVTTKKGNWTTDDIKEEGWAQAREVGRFGDVIGGYEVYKRIDKLVPPPHLRKGFEVKKAVKSARVYASAAGVYELYLNGQRVGRDVFTPGWTDYGKRVQYQSYDVTAMIRRGANTIGGIVGDGWYSGHNGLFNVNPNYYGFDKLLLAQLQIEYADGSSEVIATDETWRGKTGAIRYSDMFMGETYDARRELTGWDSPGFNDSSWQSAIAVRPNVGPLTAQADPPVRKVMELKPKRMTQPKPGVYVFDLGQNIVGWQRVKAQGKAGHKITIRNGEMLNVDGTMFTENLRTAIATDYYTLKGAGVETYEPRFTFHGFRYIELTNWPQDGGTPALDTVTGVVLHSDLEMAGVFETSNPLINKLQSNIQWGQRGNFLSVPTDCPQRDERDGWTGDIQAFSRTATFNMDSAAFLAKWLIDLEHGQDAEGSLPDIAPTSTTFGRGKFGWGDAGVMVPWTLYQVYDDRRMIAERYGMMKKWVEYLRRNAKNAAGVRQKDGGNGYLAPTDSYGDWVSPKPEAPKEILSTAYFARVTWQLAKMAEAVSKNDDAREYTDLFEKIKAAFNHAYVSEDGRIKSDTQTVYVCALKFDLLPQEKRAAAAKHLVAAIERANWHLGTGFLGAVNLMPVLTEAGYNDVAYRLLLNETMPSWGYSIRNGATTIWERWDGYDAEKGPSNMGNMNSYNHYAFGAVGEWMYANIAGIETDGPGFKRLIIRPRPGGGLTFAKAQYDSIRGRIATNWKIENGVFDLSVTIPANTTAMVYVPAASAEKVMESGKAVDKSVGVRFVGMKEGAAVYEVGSGEYHFTARAN